MTDKSFEALQYDIITKLRECFDSNRAELLQIKPVVHEWLHKISKLNQYKDPAHLRAFLLTSLGLSDTSDSNIHESTREGVIASFEKAFNAYLNFIPHENFRRASDILEKIGEVSLNSYASVTEFLSLRTELSNCLNDRRNEKCQRIQEKFSEAFKSVQAKLKDHSAHSQASTALDETELVSKEIYEALSLYNNFSANSSGDLSDVAVKRYDLNITKEDLLSLKEDKPVRSTLVDFLGMYLNERGDHKVLFLKSSLAGSLLEGKDMAIENWETERAFWLKEYSGGSIQHPEGSIWKEYKSVCIPFSDSEGEWNLLCIEHDSKVVRLIEYGAPLEEHKANLLRKNIEKYLSGDKNSGEHGTHSIVRNTYRREGQEGSINSGRSVLYAMFEIQGREEGQGEKSVLGSQEKVSEFCRKLFGTLVLIGINNEGYLKFDELL